MGSAAPPPPIVHASLPCSCRSRWEQMLPTFARNVRIWVTSWSRLCSRAEDAFKGQLGCRADGLDFLLFTLAQAQHGLVSRDENRSQKPSARGCPVAFARSPPELARRRQPTSAR